MSNYTAPLKALVATAGVVNLGGRTIVDVRNIYQALRIFKELDASPAHLGALVGELDSQLTSRSISLHHQRVTCTLEGIHPGLHDIDYRDYGYALAVARAMGSRHDNLLFITADSNPVTGTILQSDVSTNMIPRWDHFYNEQLRPDHPNAKHVLVDAAKRAFTGLDAELRRPDGLIDSKDLVYQCLFRLFSLRPSDYVAEGKIGFKTWAGIRYHETIGERLTFDDDVLRYVYFEQRADLLRRFYRPERQLYEDLAAILGPYGARGNLVVIKGDPYLVTVNGTRVPIAIREVNPSVAQRIHGSFHYIHTPRNKDYAFGLFVEGSDLPFSVLAIEKVDREYKKSALEKYALSYQHSYEVTRLYSAPNTPANTSSFILALASGYLKSLDADWQATLSSFMPSYATGASMLSGGFEEMLFVKPCRHLYAQTMLGVTTRTKRTDTSADKLLNLTELMPVVELIHTRPRVSAMIRQDTRLLCLKPEEAL